MSSLTLTMPWPAKALHPNARPHWAYKARVVRDSREYAAWTARAAGYKPAEGTISVRLTFRPPDKRRRDVDGMLSACKAMLDGIADGIGVDDSVFRLERPEVGEPVKCGSVSVTLTEMQGKVAINADSARS